MSSLDCDSGLLLDFYCAMISAVLNGIVGSGDYILALVNGQKVRIWSTFSSN